MSTETIIIIDIAATLMLTGILVLLGIWQYQRGILQGFRETISTRSQTLLDIDVNALYEIGRDVFYTGPAVRSWNPCKIFKRRPRWSITTIVWNHATKEISDVVLTFPDHPDKAEAVLVTVCSIYEFETSRNPNIDIPSIINTIHQQANDLQFQKIPAIISSELAMLVCITDNHKPRRST